MSDPIEAREQHLQDLMKEHERSKKFHLVIALCVGLLAAFGLTVHDIMTVGETWVSGGVSPSYGTNEAKTPAGYLGWAALYFSVGFGGCYGFLRSKPDADAF